MLSVIRLGIEMRANEPVELPDYTGSTFRGAFGAALKNASCLLEGGEECGKQCRQPGACAYGWLFETPVPETALERLKGSDYGPHPYLIRPVEGGGFHLAGDPIEFEIRLFGRAGRRALPRMRELVRRMCAQGLGRGRGQAELVRIEDCHGGATVIEPETDTRDLGAVEPVTPRLAPGREGHRDSDEIPKGVEITAQTPLHLLHGGDLLREADFGEFLYQSADRLRQLASCYAESPGRALELLPEPAAVATDARESDIECTEAEADLVSFDRYSHRQERKHPLRGLRGSWRFEGPIDAYLPALRAGELLHIGGKTSFGLGAIEVNVLPSA